MEVSLTTALTCPTLPTAQRVCKAEPFPLPGTHPHLANLIFVDGDVGTVDRDGDLTHIGDRRVSPVLILGGDGKGREARRPPTQGCQNIGTGAHEVKFSAIKGVIVGVTPQPAGGLVVRDTDTMAILNLACLLFQAGHSMAWIWGQKGD